MPPRRPGLAEIAQPAADARRLQADRRTGGEFEVDGSAASAIGGRAERQQTENAVLLGAVKAAIGDGFDLLESKPAQGALEGRPFRNRITAAFPAEAIGHQHKASRLTIVGKIADRDERVLEAGRYYGK